MKAAPRESVFFEDLSGEVLQDDELARLLSFPNVLVTAHQAFLTREALSEIARVTVEMCDVLPANRPFSRKPFSANPQKRRPLLRALGS